MGYQRIVRDGRVVQPGSIDTWRKFCQIVADVDLHGKTVMDVGCNSGEMCRYAKQAGAKQVCGIDTNRDFIHEARKLHPDISFGIRNALDVAGNYDIIIASAVFHYIKDHSRFFNQMARVGKQLLMDVWLLRVDYGTSQMEMTHRGGWVPNMTGFTAMAERSWNGVKFHGKAISPDGSYRRVVHLSEPAPAKAKAVLIYGPGGSGKSTHAKELLGYDCLPLDFIFGGWRRTQEPSTQMSVRQFVKDVWKEKGKRLDAYLTYHSNNIRKWLQHRVNCDVVIEGFDPIYPTYREMVLNHLLVLGWETPEQIEKKGRPK